MASYVTSPPVTNRQKRAFDDSELDSGMECQNNQNKTVVDLQDTRPEGRHAQEDPSFMFDGSREPQCDHHPNSETYLVESVERQPEDAIIASDYVRIDGPRLYQQPHDCHQLNTGTPAYASQGQELYSLDSMPESHFQGMPGVNFWPPLSFADDMNTVHSGLLSTAPSMPSTNSLSGTLRHLQQQDLNQPPLLSSSGPCAPGAFNIPPLWGSMNSFFKQPFLPTGGMLNFHPSTPALGPGPRFNIVSRSPQHRQPSPGRWLKKGKTPEPQPPTPTDEYLEQASPLPKEINPSQRLLIILDLNGTLVYRKSRRPSGMFIRRPGVDGFIQALMNNNDYTVMIWSSSQPVTVEGVCRKLFSKEDRKAIIAEWARDKLGLTEAQYYQKTQVYKRLDTVWADASIQATYRGPRRSGRMKRIAGRENHTLPQKMRWDQSNTILIDDSKLKALGQPYNIIEIPEFSGDVEESNVFPTVLAMLRILSKHDDVSKVLRQWSLAEPSITMPSYTAREDEKQSKPANIISETNSSNSRPSSAGTTFAPPGGDIKQARKERRKARKRQRKQEKEEEKIRMAAERLRRRREKKEATKPARLAKEVHERLGHAQEHADELVEQETTMKQLYATNDFLEDEKLAREVEVEVFLPEAIKETLEEQKLEEQRLKEEQLKEKQLEQKRLKQERLREKRLKRRALKKTNKEKNPKEKNPEEKKPKAQELGNKQKKNETTKVPATATIGTGALLAASSTTCNDDDNNDDSERCESQVSSKVSSLSDSASPRRTAPSPVTSSGEENYLLDRLEEALGLKNL